jgi:hypothetical protein
MNTPQPAADPSSRLAATQPIATLAVAALTIATAISMCRVFPDWAYLEAMVVVVLGTHLVAAGLRFARLPLFVALPLLLFGIVELLGLVYYGNTLTAGLPGSRTLELMRLDLRSVLDQFPTAIAPVPSTGNWAVASTASLAVCAAMSDTFAFRAMGRLETIAPTGVVFVFTAALGTERHRITVAALWIGAALLVVGVLRWPTSRRPRVPALGCWRRAHDAHHRRRRRDGRRGRAALPGAGAEPLYDTRNQAGSAHRDRQPARRHRQPAAQPWQLRTVHGAVHRRTPLLALTGLPVFDGRSWERRRRPAGMGDRRDRLPGRHGQQIITTRRWRQPSAVCIPAGEAAR